MPEDLYMHMEWSTHLFTGSGRACVYASALRQVCMHAGNYFSCPVAYLQHCKVQDHCWVVTSSIDPWPNPACFCILPGLSSDTAWSWSLHYLTSGLLLPDSASLLSFWPCLLLMWHWPWLGSCLCSLSPEFATAWLSRTLSEAKMLREAPLAAERNIPFRVVQRV